MQLIKLSEEQLKNISTPLNLQRAENYVGKFYDCSVNGAELTGKIRGNHGVYEVKLKIDTDPIDYQCDCETSKETFCKHTAALGLTYIYTPWVFKSDEKIDRSNINNTEELLFYVKTTKLKELLDELKAVGIASSKVAELTGLSMQQLLTIAKDDNNGKNHQLTDPVKLSCLYLLEKNTK